MGTTRYEAVIFDLYGTLVDNFSFREHERVIRDMSSALGLTEGDFVPLWEETLPDRHIGQFMSIEDNLRHICETLGVSADKEDMSAATEIRLRFSRRSLVPRPEAVDTLGALRNGGHKIGLISDCASDVPGLWSETPFEPLVDVPVFSCAVGLKKPDPKIYRLTCEKLGVAPADCLYIGDGSSKELSGARRVGMRAVLCRVDLEDVYDQRREDVDGWRGAEVSALSETLALVSAPQPAG